MANKRIKSKKIKVWYARTYEIVITPIIFIPVTRVVKSKNGSTYKIVNIIHPLISNCQN